MTLPQSPGGRSGAVVPGPGPGGPGPGATTEGAPPPELNGGYDAALFGPTDRPGEPVTTGMPFGAGPSFVPLPTEDTRTFMLRVANDLSANPELAAYVAKIRSGA